MGKPKNVANEYCHTNNYDLLPEEVGKGHITAKSQSKCEYKMRPGGLLSFLSEVSAITTA